MYCWLQGILPCGSTRNVAWKGEWLLVGTDDGALRTLRIPVDVPKPAQAEDGNTPLSRKGGGNSRHGQELAVHVGQVCCVRADAVSGLVATGDTEGGISIWEETAAGWHRRACFGVSGSGSVVGLQWLYSGDQSSNIALCVLDETGRLHSTTPEGLRLWSRDLRKPCTRFCAVPNGEAFVLATQDCDLLLYDSRGVYTRKLALKANSHRGEAITALAWQPGSWALRPLLVAYSSGRAVLLHTDGGSEPVAIDTGLTVCVGAEWSPSGAFVAIFGVAAFGCTAPLTSGTGTATPRHGGPEARGLHAPGMMLRVVQASGEAVASVELPCGDPRAVAWSPSGKRIVAAATESLFIFLVRHDGMCCFYGGHTLAAGALLSQELATEVCFWRRRASARARRVFRGPRLLTCAGARCAIVPHATAALPPNFLWDADGCSSLQQQQQQQHGPFLLPEDQGPWDASAPQQQQKQEHKCEGFPVEICDTAGNTVDIVVSPLGPRHAALLTAWLIVSDGSQRLWCCRLGAEGEKPPDHSSSVIDLDTLSGPPACKGAAGEVTALAGHGEWVAVGRAGGQLLRLKLSPTVPEAHIEAWGLAPCGLGCLRFSSETTALAGRDAQGRLHILRASAGNTGPSAGFSEELCDPIEHALDYLWASDHEGLIAVLQPTRMLLLSTGQGANASPSYMAFGSSERAAVGPLYLMDFSGLCATAFCASLFPEDASTEFEHRMVTYDAEPLFQMRQLVDLRRRGAECTGGTGKLQQATALAESISHPTLWRLLADAALANEHLDITEEALVRCEDYSSLQILKRAQRLGVRGEGRPVIAALSGDVLGAGAFYEAQRKHTDAARLFISFGHWQAAADILKMAEPSPTRGGSTGLREAYTALAEAWSDLGKWHRAIDAYRKVSPQKGLLEALFLSENYEELEDLAEKLPEEEPELVLRAAQLLAAAGRGSPAAMCFLKAGMPQQAVNAALQGGDWKAAIHLARQYGSNTKVQEIATAYRAAIQHQQNENSTPDTVEAFTILGIPEAISQELNGLTHQLDTPAQYPQRQRKLHVMAALLARHRRLRERNPNCCNLGPAGCNSAAKTTSAEEPLLHGVGEFSLSPTEQEQRQWRSAAAYHLYLLCCFHLSERRVRAALCVAVRLRDCYSKYLPLQIRGRLLFISACKAKEWDLCSQALHALQTNPKVSYGERKMMDTTSLSLFIRPELHEPPRPRMWLRCTRCKESSGCWECFCPSCDLPFPWCSATGLPIRYITHLLRRDNADGVGRAAALSANAGGLKNGAKEDGWTPRDPDDYWPYSGPSTPKLCGVCGLSTAAWGPGGPMDCCALCNQLFSSAAGELSVAQNAPLLEPEDEKASYMSTINPEEILRHIGDIDAVTQSQALKCFHDNEKS